MLMSIISTLLVRHTPRFFTFLGLIGLLGCHAARPLEPEAAAPEAFATTPSDETPSYAAWRQHTSGRVGEDLFGFPARDGAVVFASNRHSESFKLYLQPGNEIAVHRLTHGPGDDAYPALSGEGKLAFASSRTGTWQIYVQDDLGDASPRRIGEESVEAIHPAWSPDGGSVAYSRRSPVTGAWEVWVVDLQTNQERYVTDGLFPEFRPPAGDLIVFQRPRKRDREWYSIWTVRSDGTGEREIVAGKEWGAVNPGWSPDGRRIVFNTVGKTASPRPGRPDRGDDLYCIDHDGTRLQRLTSTPGAEWNPNWSTSGERILFTADRTGETAIWSIRAPL